MAFNRIDMTTNRSRDSKYLSNEGETTTMTMMCVCMPSNHLICDERGHNAFDCHQMYTLKNIEYRISLILMDRTT